MLLIELLRIMNKRELLFIDTRLYEINLKHEGYLKKLLQDLEHLAVKVLGSIDNIDNYRALIDNPSNYLVTSYWSMFCDNRPEHLNREKVMQNDTNVSLNQLEQIRRSWIDTVSKLHPVCRPQVNAKGVTWCVTDEPFKCYLSEDKKSHYHALKRFLKAYNNLLQHEPNNPVSQIHRWSQNMTIQGLELDIVKENFK